MIVHPQTRALFEVLLVLRQAWQPARRGALLALSAMIMGAGPVAAESFAVFKSSDQGRTWTRSDAGLPRHSRINAFGRLEEALFAGTDGGIYTSLDSGRTWNPSLVRPLSRRAISFATSGSAVFAGTDDSGILMSTNKGASWATLSFAPRKVRSLLARGGMVYAGTDSAGVLVSTNNGVAWKEMRDGLPNDAQVFALAAVNDRLFAGLYGKGLYCWSEQALRWAKTGSVSPLVLADAGESLIVGHNPGGVYWSDDNGVSWAEVSTPAEQS